MARITTGIAKVSIRAPSGEDATSSGSGVIGARAGFNPRALG